ncbi:hypothetical protein RJ641_024480 [Dillenia turbinata]|uniref:PAP/OAS1 substrate-binding-related domain-containing protein n=1 Tax=Dillenia turbinata TaxID=194707 RepID=A0AAN8WBB2_9MAGN
MVSLRLSSPELSSDDVPDQSGHNLAPISISDEQLIRAEKTVESIVGCVLPTVESENRRNRIIHFFQSLLSSRIDAGLKIFPLGSVQLMTYLPDGDIDLTVFGLQHRTGEDLAKDVFSVLERESQNPTGDFLVKDVQFIDAEVKLVKCLVQNIVVDISFNQVGGLCALCFLEKIDRLIGKDHLFKRSIILIKAWCYYESRILGAHHGLLSTYALEILVLYIFNLFHSSLDGPFAVLYKFLDYFSKFSWDKYCITIDGPVCLSSLPELMVEASEIDGCDLLLNDKFHADCRDMFTPSFSKRPEPNVQGFTSKHLNIVDPLKKCNNLGRSVSKGNAFRIRSAFLFGARKLGCILSNPEQDTDGELRNFFANTLDRHGHGERPDIKGPFPVFGINGLSVETCQKDETACGSRFAHSSEITGGHRLDQVLSHDIISTTSVTCKVAIAVSRFHLSDADDLATPRGYIVRSDDGTDDGTSKIYIPNGRQGMSKPTAYHAPHLYFCDSSKENENLRNGNQEQHEVVYTGFTNWGPPGILQVYGDKTGFVGPYNYGGDQIAFNHEILSPACADGGFSFSSSPVCFSEEFNLGYGESFSASTSGSPVAPNSLSGLRGHYNSQLLNLRCGWLYYESDFGTNPEVLLQLLQSQFQEQYFWDSFTQSAPFGQLMLTYPSFLFPIPAFFSINPPYTSSSTTLGVEGMMKHRGTGTYLPNMNRSSTRNGHLIGKGRYRASERSPRGNGRTGVNLDKNLLERSGGGLTQLQISVHQGNGQLRTSHQSTSGMIGHQNGVMSQPEVDVEFGSLGHQPIATLSINTGGVSRNPVPTLPNSVQSAELAPNTNHDRAAVGPYQLKDDGDFPPLRRGELTSANTAV